MKTKAPRCPYCERRAELTTTQHGHVWACGPCGARVGCHRETERPKGTLADAPTRLGRIRAHAVFDVLWKEKLARNAGLSKSRARHAAYRWLSLRMHMPIEATHIGRFTLAQCEDVIRHCQPFVDAVNRQRAAKASAGRTRPPRDQTEKRPAALRG